MSNQHCNFIILLIASVILQNTVVVMQTKFLLLLILFTQTASTQLITQSGFSIATQHCHHYIVIIATLKLISVAEPGSSVGSPSQFGRGLGRQRS